MVRQTNHLILIIFCIFKMILLMHHIHRCITLFSMEDLFAFLNAGVSAFHSTAAAAAMAVMASAGEKAGARAKGPGSFLPAFLDELYLLDPEDAASRVHRLESSAR